MSSSGAGRDGGGAAPDTPRTADDKLVGESFGGEAPKPERPPAGEAAGSDPRRATPMQSPTSGERTSRKERAERRSAGPSGGAAVRVAGEDTLLSAPAPAASFEIEVDDRLNTLERDTDDIKHRLVTLESRLERAQKPALPAQSWLVWVVFMLALALGYQLLFRGR